MSSVITTILTLLLTLLPQITDSKSVSAVIQMLLNLVPIIVKEAKEVLPLVQNIIDLLRSKDDLTMEQLDQLDVISAEVDAAWDKAIGGFNEENPDGD